MNPWTPPPSLPWRRNLSDASTIRMAGEGVLRITDAKAKSLSSMRQTDRPMTEAQDLSLQSSAFPQTFGTLLHRQKILRWLLRADTPPAVAKCG